MKINENKKITYKYICELCDYKCRKMCDFNKHNLTQKHNRNKMKINENIKVAKNSDCGNIHTFDTSIVTPINVTTQIKLDIENICKCCNYKCRNIYNFNRHLLSAKHKKKCTAQTCENIETEINYKDMFIKMITENKELHKLLIDQQKQIGELIPIVGNNNKLLGIIILLIIKIILILMSF